MNASEHWIEAHIPAPWSKLFAATLWDSAAHCPADAGMQALLAFVKEEYDAAEAGGTPIYPPRPQLFAAFAETPPEQVRVVLLGQDPYHGEGQAQGLSFSVPQGVRTPPSLRNIFKERESDLGIPAEGASPCLHPWARQGVLLLNTTLTVRAASAGSHRKRGWEIFTDRILTHLDASDAPMVFVLWGADARRKHVLLQNPRHLVLQSEHPSPLSAYRGFFGSAPFSKINDYLKEHGLAPIDWAT